MNIAIIGCGWVADAYMRTLPGHPGLTLRGAFDRDPLRLDAFTAFWRVPAYPDLAALLGDPTVDLVLNLTNPRSHWDISDAALRAGKHVYSEKPLGMTMKEAEQLTTLAAERGLALAAAPCNHLAPPPHNRSLRLVGTTGFATIGDVWDNAAPPIWSATGNSRQEKLVRKIETTLARWLPGATLGRALKMTRWPRQPKAPGMDFARGAAQLAAQVEAGAPPLVGPALALHVTGVTLALQDMAAAGQRQAMRTTP